MKKPIVFAVAGIPSAGKTTFVKKQLQLNAFPQDCFIHDCDAVMVSLPQYQEDLRNLGAKEAFARWEMPARIIAEERLKEAYEAHHNIIYDRSCALMSSFYLLELLVMEKDYVMDFYFLDVDPEVAKIRAKKRELEIGRHTPPELIDERWHQLQKLLPQYKQISTQFHQVCADKAFIL